MPAVGKGVQAIRVRDEAGAFRVIYTARLADAVAQCGVTQPRINDLLRGRISRFSLDALVNIAAALGRRVQVELAQG